jgi:hypothetical protein
VIFGSAALGELKPDRQTNLLVIGDVRLKEVVDALATVPVHPRVSSMADFRKKVAEDPPFLTTLLSESHLFVIGGSEDLGRPSRRRRMGSNRNEARRWSKRTD